MNVLRNLKLIPDCALLARAANVFQRDTRISAHCAENPVLRMKNIRSVEFGNIPVVHHAYTIVRDDSPQPVYGRSAIRDIVTMEREEGRGQVRTRDA